MAGPQQHLPLLPNDAAILDDGRLKYSSQHVDLMLLICNMGTLLNSNIAGGTAKVGRFAGVEGPAGEYVPGRRVQLSF